MILVNNIVLSDKVRQAFVDSGEEDIWDGILDLVAKRYHFTKDELDQVVKDGNELLV